MQKARRHTPKGALRPLVSTWFQGLFHSSVRGSFHLSLTVLVHYRSLWKVFSLGGWSRRFHARFLVSRATQDTGRLPIRFVYGIITLYDRSFQNVPLQICLATSRSYNPNIAETILVWASPGSLATTSGITICFLFLWVLRCFSSPRLLSV